ncbi:DUF4328 domain-containing protein [Streptomyces pinistramenti]|uniref:DUF4328 domain-containing protein n=1 Tax=Streptomyces pinistramenti TaxID=2884812 RepID=UPI001D07CF11|nr:DUF4328 domain-containing protein [Streptomyces pinistramenti]MCB5908251.1 DUF4328 domain-containing protein [Streptomyces pinistramenti]
MSHMPVAPPPPSSNWSVPRGPQAVLRSPVGLSKAVKMLLRLVVVADLYALWQGWQLYGLAGRIIGDFGSVTAQEIDRADTLYAASGKIQAVAMLATAVVFIVWFHRTRVNADVFAPEHHAKGRGWAIWGWIVPVVNLWFPRRIALDTWNASAGANSPSRALVNWWWTLWIVDLIFGRLASTRYARAETPDEIRGALAGLMASDVFDIVAAVLAILFVRRLTHMQNEKALRGPTL